MLSVLINGLLAAVGTKADYVSPPIIPKESVGDIGGKVALFYWIAAVKLVSTYPFSFKK